MELRLCLKCGENKEEKNFPLTSDKIHRDRTCYSCRGKKERAKLKLDMIKALGGKCECCGESHLYFLTLDHRNNNGPEHREKFNEQQIYRLARRENFDKSKWQLLCMNCNFAKGHFKECPHRLGITAEQALHKLEDLVKGIGYDNIQHNTSNIAEARAARMAKLPSDHVPRSDSVARSLDNKALKIALELLKQRGITQ